MASMRVSMLGWVENQLSSAHGGPHSAARGFQGGDEGLGRMAGVAQQPDGIRVGGAFELPGVAGRRQGQGEGRQLLDEDFVGAENRAEQDQQSRRPQHLPHGVPFLDVTQLVRDHRDDQVLRLHEVHELIRHDHRSARKREGVGADLRRASEQDPRRFGHPLLLDEPFRRASQGDRLRRAQIARLQQPVLQLRERAPADGGLERSGDEVRGRVRQGGKRGPQGNDDPRQQHDADDSGPGREPLRPGERPPQAVSPPPEESLRKLAEGHEGLAGRHDQALRDAVDEGGGRDHVDDRLAAVVRRQDVAVPAPGQAGRDAVRGAPVVEVSGDDHMLTSSPSISANSCPNAATRRASRSTNVDRGTFGATVTRSA